MDSHELARRLLALPNRPVVILGGLLPVEIVDISNDVIETERGYEWANQLDPTEKTLEVVCVGP